MARLDKLDVDQRIGRHEYQQRLVVAQRRLLQLRLHLGGQMGTGELGPALLVVFEGPDAAGKGGALKRVVEPLDPRPIGCRRSPRRRSTRSGTISCGASIARSRGSGAWSCSIGAGTAACVERIEGYATREQWVRAYDEIVGFEETLVREGMILVKFWLHISDDEQLRRFEDRTADPLRRWKITEEDWRNRTRNREYDLAAEEMFRRTDHEMAPWDLIGANQKRFARVSVLEKLTERIEQGMRRWGSWVPLIDDLQDDGGS